MDISFLIDLIKPWTVVLVLSIGRPFGMMITFVAFSWAQVQSGPLLMAFAVSIALPVFSLSSPELPDLIAQASTPVALLLVKEILIGALIGWLVSLPLSTASAAGDIIDTYWGNSNGGSDPTGGQITVTANLFMITSLGLFASIGGFWILTNLLYESYAAWPMTAGIPNISAGMAPIIGLVSTLIKSALVLAAPILIIMFLSDVLFLVAAKLGKKINITFLTSLTKTLAAIIMLPLFSFVFIQVQKTRFSALPDLSHVIRQFLQ